MVPVLAQLAGDRGILSSRAAAQRCPLPQVSISCWIHSLCGATLFRRSGCRSSPALDGISAVPLLLKRAAVDRGVYIVCGKEPHLVTDATPPPRLRVVGALENLYLLAPFKG